MGRAFRPDTIRALGFEWPRSSVIEEKCVVAGDAVDLDETLARLESGLAFYEREIDKMYEFAQKWSAPVDEITDKRDEYGDARLAHREAIAHVKEILRALE